MSSRLQARLDCGYSIHQINCAKAQRPATTSYVVGGMSKSGRASSYGNIHRYLPVRAGFGKPFGTSDTLLTSPHVVPRSSGELVQQRR